MRVLIVLMFLTACAPEGPDQPVDLGPSTVESVQCRKDPQMAKHWPGDDPNVDAPKQVIPWPCTNGTVTYRLVSDPSIYFITVGEPYP